MRRICSMRSSAGGVKKADASLATELTLGVLRWQRLLDFLLERYLERRGEQLDMEVLLALRLGLYQLRYLDRVPQHAAINESVELVKRARKSSAAGMVNAVLRRGAAEARIGGDDLDKLIPSGWRGARREERLGILYSHPTWLVARWLRSFGKERTTALLEANNRPAPLTCAVLEEETSESVAESLRKSGLEVARGRWLRGALHLSGGDAAASEAYRAGEINFQDEASQMVAHLVDARDSQSVLDLCAAPGGKTILLARAAGEGGRRDRRGFARASLARHAAAIDAHASNERGAGGAGCDAAFAILANIRSHLDRRAVLGDRHAFAQSGNSLAAQARRLGERPSQPDRDVAECAGGRGAVPRRSHPGGVFDVLAGAGRK